MDATEAYKYPERVPDFEHFPEHLTWRSVLADRTKGMIYDEALKDSKAALIWDKGHHFFLTGNFLLNAFKPMLREVLDKTIFPTALEQPDLQDFLVFCDTADWEGQWAEIWSHKQLMPVSRLYFRHPPEGKSSGLAVPAEPAGGWTLRAIDQQLLKEKGLENVEAIKSWIRECWKDSAGFLQYGFGYCYVRDKVIGSWCLTDHVIGNRCQIGVETDSRFWRQGLGYGLVAQMLKTAVSRGLETGWHCWESNEASARLAKKAGFEFVKKVQAYFGWFNQYDNLLINGNVAMGRKAWKEAARFYYFGMERLFPERDSIFSGEPAPELIKDRDQQMRFLFLAAQAGSMAEDHDLTHLFLNKALETGLDPESIHSHPRLENFRQSTYWNQLKWQ